MRNLTPIYYRLKSCNYQVPEILYYAKRSRETNRNSGLHKTIKIRQNIAKIKLYITINERKKQVLHVRKSGEKELKGSNLLPATYKSDIVYFDIL